jgi:hypothetical protein
MHLLDAYYRSHEPGTHSIALLRRRRMSPPRNTRISGRTGGYRAGVNLILRKCRRALDSVA